MSTAPQPQIEQTSTVLSIDEANQRILTAREDLISSISNALAILGGFSFVGISILLTLENKDLTFSIIFVINNICSVILVSLSVIGSILKLILVSIERPLRNEDQVYSSFLRTSILIFILFIVSVIVFWLNVSALSFLAGTIVGIITSLTSLAVIILAAWLIYRYTNIKVDSDWFARPKPKLSHKLSDPDTERLVKLLQRHRGRVGYYVYPDPIPPRLMPGNMRHKDAIALLVAPRRSANNSLAIGAYGISWHLDTRRAISMGSNPFSKFRDCDDNYLRSITSNMITAIRASSTNKTCDLTSEEIFSLLVDIRTLSQNMNLPRPEA